jgi:hypothetical protein
MTMPDLPERPGHASDTREMVEAERQRILGNARVGNWSFVIAMAMIIVAIILAILLLR